MLGRDAMPWFNSVFSVKLYLVFAQSLLRPKPPLFSPQRRQTLWASTQRVFGAPWASSGPVCSFCRLAATARSSMTRASWMTSKRAPAFSGRSDSDFGKCSALAFTPPPRGEKSRLLTCGEPEDRKKLFVLRQENLTTLHPNSPQPSFYSALNFCL